MAEQRILTAEKRQELEVALERVQSTQTLFWEAMRDLEKLLGDDVELDDNTDYQDYDVDALLEMEPDEEDEE